MTTPKHATETERGRYYVDPATGDLLVSVTNALQQLAKPSLVPAAASETVKYMMANLDAAASASGDPFEKAAFEKAARRAYRDAWDARRDLGSRVHHRAEAHVLEAPTAPDPETDPFVAQYRAFLAEAAIDILRDVAAAELTVLNRTLGYAGTADLWVWINNPPQAWGIEPGLWLVDMKTSTTSRPSALYDEQPMQLAALRYAEVAIAPDDSEHEVPEFVGTAILNLRADRYGFVPVPGDRAAFAAFERLVAVCDYMHNLDLKPYKPVNDWKYKPSRKVAA